MFNIFNQPQKTPTMLKARNALFALVFTGVSGLAQNSSEIVIPQVFEKSNPTEEINRLEDKKFKLTLRINELKAKDALGNAEEIVRIENVLIYIDDKIDVQKKILLSENYAKELGVPQKDKLSNEEYRSKKLELYSKQEDKPLVQIQTKITRYEFEALPKDRQEKILSMPERYTIID